MSYNIHVHVQKASPICVCYMHSAIEQFARAKCDMNLKKDDGYAAIHLAALNDHLDVVTALAELVSFIAYT